MSASRRSPASSPAACSGSTTSRGPNWTRNRGDLLGTAFLYVDYSVPVEPIRAELQRVVSGSPLWDKRVCGLQVTNLTDRTMELRCLVSSSSSSQSFDLRCLVREKMIEFLQAKYPHALPTLRVVMKENGEKPKDAAPLPPSSEGPQGNDQATDQPETPSPRSQMSPEHSPPESPERPL